MFPNEKLKCLSPPLIVSQSSFHSPPFLHQLDQLKAFVTLTICFTYYGCSNTALVALKYLFSRPICLYNKHRVSTDRIMRSKVFYRTKSAWKRRELLGFVHCREMNVDSLSTGLSSCCKVMMACLQCDVCRSPRSKGIQMKCIAHLAGQTSDRKRRGIDPHLQPRASHWQQAQTVTATVRVSFGIILRTL